jgi:AcrR family transcriptional regulator
MPRGVTKRRPVTVTALLDAAMELFADQGYGATSIPDICARAGLTKGAFYSNFANKEALFLALLDRSWSQRAQWIRRAMPKAGDLAHDHDADGTVAELPVDRQWTLVSMEFSLYAIRHPEVARLLVEHEVRVRSELSALVAESLERVHRIPLIAPEELARMIVAVSEGSDIQVLTDSAASGIVHGELGSLAVAALLRQLSVPAGSVPSPEDGALARLQLEVTP